MSGVCLCAWGAWGEWNGEWDHVYSLGCGSHAAAGVGVSMFPGSEQGVKSICVPHTATPIAPSTVVVD